VLTGSTQRLAQSLRLPINPIELNRSKFFFFSSFFLIYFDIFSPPVSVAAKPGNTKGGSITVSLTSVLIGLDKSVLQIKTKIVSHTADCKPVKQEVDGTVILPP
jgi:hypothetical protein